MSDDAPDNGTHPTPTDADLRRNAAVLRCQLAAQRVRFGPIRSVSTGQRAFDNYVRPRAAATPTGERPVTSAQLQ